jgi:hypothetical protein
LRNEVARLKDALAEKNNVEEAGKKERNDEKTDEVRGGLEQRGVLVKNLPKVEQLDNVEEVVEEFSIEVSSEEETSECGGEKLIIDETPKKESLSKHVKATSVKRKASAKKTKGLKKGKGVGKNAEHVSTTEEDIPKTKTVFGKVQDQLAKEKGKGKGYKAKECSGPFQCSMDECQDSWVKVPGWERKVNCEQCSLNISNRIAVIFLKS